MEPMDSSSPTRRAVTVSNLLTSIILALFLFGLIFGMGFLTTNGMIVFFTAIFAIIALIFGVILFLFLWSKSPHTLKGRPKLKKVMNQILLSTVVVSAVGVLGGAIYSSIWSYLELRAGGDAFWTVLSFLLVIPSGAGGLAVGLCLGIIIAFVDYFRSKRNQE